MRFFLGDLAEYAEPFELGVALHACGTASDLVLEACVRAGARFAVCPCCTGKLSDERRDVRARPAQDHTSRPSEPLAISPPPQPLRSYAL